MNGIAIISAIILLSSATHHPVNAQISQKVYKIGYLTAGSAKAFKQRVLALKQGLKKLGYEEGTNVIIEERYAAGKRTLLPALAADLVNLDVDILVTHGGTSTSIAARTTKTSGKSIPIVFALLADPVGNGFVQSLARPGGNITGLSNVNELLVNKRLSILKEAVPFVRRVAVLWSPVTQNSPIQLNLLKTFAPKLELTLIPVEFAKANDFDQAFAEILNSNPDALMILNWSLTNSFREQIAMRALENGLATIYGNRRHVLAGGLLSYGVNVPDMYRRAAIYVDKILKGAKPSSLPVELPTKFSLTVNLETAKALRIRIPPSILLRAEEVIE